MLGGGVARLFGELLSPLYLPAVLTRQVETNGRGGQLQRSATSLECRAQVDRCTERMVGTEGYTATDRGIYILADSLDGSAETGDDIVVSEGPYAGAVYTLASPIDRDPAGAYWLARGVAKRVPANG